MQKEIPSDKNEAELEKQITDFEKDLRDTQEHYSKLAGPLERLRTEGQILLQDLPGQHKCPLCCHDHGSPEALHAAIKEAGTALPDAAAALARQVNNLKQRILAEKNRKKHWQELRKQLVELTKTREILRTEVAKAANTLKAIGFQLEDLSRSDLPKVLEDRRSEAEKRKDVLANDNQHKQNLLMAAHALRNEGWELHLLELDCQGVKSSGSAPIDSLLGLPPITWPDRLKALSEELTPVLQQALAKTSASNAEVTNFKEHIEKLTTELGRIKQEQDQTTQKADSIKSTLQTLQTEWQVLAGNNPRTDEMLNSMSHELEQTDKELSEAGIHLKAANEQLEQARAAELEERCRLETKKQYQYLLNQQRKLRNLLKRCEGIDQGIQVLSQQKRDYVAAQLEPLRNIITTFYLRAQSNEFIDCINVKADEGGALTWLAQIGDKRLDDVVQLSQGQRQDLALAIFLARARSIGGTFFLDEPLLHLDDLNRVALLDIIRVLVAERTLNNPLKLVITTASDSLVRHFREKFSLLPSSKSDPLPIRIYRLYGDPRHGINKEEEPQKGGIIGPVGLC